MEVIVTIVSRISPLQLAVIATAALAGVETEELGSNLPLSNTLRIIAELSGKAEMLTRTEGYAKRSQGQRIESEKI